MGLERVEAAGSAMADLETKAQGELKKGTVKTPPAATEEVGETANSAATSKEAEAVAERKRAAKNAARKKRRAAKAAVALGATAEATATEKAAKKTAKKKRKAERRAQVAAAKTTLAATQLAAKQAAKREKRAAKAMRAAAEKGAPQAFEEGASMVDHKGWLVPSHHAVVHSLSGKSLNIGWNLGDSLDNVGCLKAEVATAWKIPGRFQEVTLATSLADAPNVGTLRSNSSALHDHDLLINLEQYSLVLSLQPAFSILDLSSCVSERMAILADLAVLGRRGGAVAVDLVARFVEDFALAGFSGWHRSTAIKTLGRIAEEGNQRALSTLFGCLGVGDNTFERYLGGMTVPTEILEDAAIACIRVLMSKDSYESIDLLHAILRDRTRRGLVRAASLEALSKVLSRCDLLADAAACVGDSDSRVKLAAFWILVDPCEEYDPPVIDSMISCLADERLYWKVIEALSRARGNQLFIASVIRFADGAECYGRRRAIHALTQVANKGDQNAIAAVAAWAVEGDAVVSATCVQNLEKLAEKGDRVAIAAVAKALDKFPTLKTCAERVLTHLAENV